MHSYSFVHNPPSACSVSNHQRWAKTNHVCALKWKEGCQGTITILKSVPLCTQTYRQANRKVDRQTERPTGRQTCRKTGRKADRQADIQAGRQTGRKAGRKADRQKDRQKGRYTDRQTGAQADRCAGRHGLVMRGRWVINHLMNSLDWYLGWCLPLVLRHPTTARHTKEVIMRR